MNDQVSQAMQGVPLNYYIWLSAALFVIGVMGVLYRRNAIVIFMCIELMLNAVNLLLVAFSSFHRDGAGQIFVLFYNGGGCGGGSRGVGNPDRDLPQHPQY